jgi:hypothetical protein
MAAMSDAEYKALAGRAYAAFKKYPNVHSVGLGGRERKGEPTGELAVRVFVTRKLSPGELGKASVIPAEFEGLPTDVVEMGEFKLTDLTDIPSMPADDTNEDSEKHRPLQGGIQIQGSLNIGKGTLGLLAKVQGDTRVMAVTCYHVLFDNKNMPQTNIDVGNPDYSRGCSDCCVGAFGKHVAQDYTVVDAAIASLDPHTQWLAEIKCIGFITGWDTVTPAQAKTHTYRVRKYGRTTRLTGGIVTDVNIHGTITADNLPARTFTNRMVIQPNPQPGGGKVKFGDHGDSGSAVVNDDNKIVGVLYAVVLDQSVASFGVSSAFPVADMAARFQAQNSIQLVPATATAMNQVQTVASALGASASVQTRAEVETMVRRLETDLSRTERGRLMNALWLRHSSECNQLVNGNRRVGALWRRNCGPAIFQHAIRLAEAGAAIPATIEGRSVDECVLNIFDGFARYGSEPLQADLRAHRAVIPILGGRSYEELLATLTEQNQPFR